jgi:hypothetical protein
MGENKYGSEASTATNVAESASSLIITRLSVLLIGTNVIATATWINPNWKRFKNIFIWSLLTNKGIKQRKFIR